MLDRLRLAIDAFRKGFYTDFKGIMDTKNLRIQYLEEKVSMLERENFSLTTHI